MPVAVLIEKAETVFALWLLTKSTLWTESKAMNSAPAPALNGEPESVESPPVVLMAKAETVAEPELLTKANAAVWPGAEGGLPIMLQPTKPAKIRMSEAGTRKSKARTVGGSKRCDSEIMRISTRGDEGPQRL